MPETGPKPARVRPCSGLVHITVARSGQNIFFFDLLEDLRDGGAGDLHFMPFGHRHHGIDDALLPGIASRFKQGGRNKPEPYRAGLGMDFRFVLGLQESRAFLPYPGQIQQLIPGDLLFQIDPFAIAHLEHVRHKRGHPLAHVQVHLEW